VKRKEKDNFAHPLIISVWSPKYPFVVHHWFVSTLKLHTPFLNWL